jgi:hypothetical protein
MIERIKWTLSIPAFLLSGLLGCGLFGVEAQTDGEVCSTEDDCSTGVCTSGNLCSHSRCECPSGNCAAGGEQTDDCLDGWVCVGYDSILDPVKEFFGGTPKPDDGYCQPSCAAGCPDHYVCSDEFCTPDVSWAYPVPTISWTGAATGELSGRDQSMTVVVEGGSTISLTGSAESPSGAAIVSLDWTTVSEAGDYASFAGTMIETTVPTGAGSYHHVELDVADDQHRGGHITVTFEACLGPGSTCGYAGSGCCGSCDAGTNSCL